LYNTKADFYEKALEDSANLQRVLEQVKSGRVDQRAFLKLKDKRKKKSINQGAGAIYSKHILENSKVGILTNYKELMMGLFYIAFGVLFKMDFTFVFGMIGFSSLTMSLNDSWHSDFKRPYVFLIPESSFKKVIFSVLPGLQKSILCGSVSMILAGLVFKKSPADLISFIVLFISFSILFVFAEVVTYRILGGGVSAIVMVFVRMMFAIFACIPAIICVIILSIIAQGAPSLLSITFCMLVSNIAISAVLAFLSRGIFEKSEIMC
jgi:hypothetical protein